VSPADRVAALFAETYGTQPTGVWSSPGRVNLIGEHTDYTGGFVMPLAIEERAYLAARPRSDRRIRAVASGRGLEEVDLDDVGPGRPKGWLAYLSGSAWVAEANAPDGARPGHGWDLALLSDVPVGAGLSSSAAITCATLLAMDELGGWQRPLAELARWGQQVENVVVGMPCGIMDQTASLLCTTGTVLFMDTESGAIEHVPWPASSDDAVLLVTNTNAPHVLADGQYADRRRQCEEATDVLGVPSLRSATLADLDSATARLTADQAACARHVITENARVLNVRALLEAGRISDVGPELTASHASLRDDFRVTVPQLDVSVAAALSAGAFGARMTGGGFGGCTIALVRREDIDDTAQAITAAFAVEAFTPPEHFVARPAQGGRRDL
jgi:galactokinase